MITLLTHHGYFAEHICSQKWLARPQITLNKTIVCRFLLRRRSPEYQGKNPDRAEFRTNMTTSREHNVLHIDGRRKLSLIHNRNCSNETCVLRRWGGETLKFHLCSEMHIIRGMLNFLYASRSVPLSLSVNHLFVTLGLAFVYGLFLG